RMIEEGLFARFPVEAVYGLHNMPGLPAGQFAFFPGPMLASLDNFRITVRGRGAHAAFPHQAIDPVVVQAHVVMALQTIVSRATDPLAAAVCTVTQVHGGAAWNVIPDSVELCGTL